MLKAKAADLPEKPGIYFFKNAAGDVVYIGKARDLHDRVKSYFQPTDDIKVRSILSEAADIDYILTGSEREAAFLENNFVQQLQPKFNLRLKDDKSFPYLKLTVKDAFPAVMFSRKVAADGARYFGPFSPAREARIIALTRQPPPAPLTHWSVRRLARRVGVSPATVHRVWQRAGLQPHRLERYVASPDPDFERKAADIIGWYLNPPAHAAIFCVDEKTTIQALDRREPVLPLSPGRAERHGFEYVRHGTLSLYAALEVGTGHVEGMTAPRHTSREFVVFLDRVVATQPTDREIHLIVDNLSAHKTPAVRQWLAAHPSAHLHFTPTYSSWLNQIELWFAKIERDCIARGIFTSTADLRRKLMQYIRAHNTHCHPFRWTYRNVRHRIRTNVNPVTVH
jgi:transposase